MSQALEVAVWFERSTSMRIVVDRAEDLPERSSRRAHTRMTLGAYRKWIELIILSTSLHILRCLQDVLRALPGCFFDPTQSSARLSSGKSGSSCQAKSSSLPGFLEDLKLFICSYSSNQRSRISSLARWSLFSFLIFWRKTL